MSVVEHGALTDELRRLVAWPTQSVAASSRGLRRLAQRHHGRLAASDAEAFALVLRLIASAIAGINSSVDLLLPNGQQMSLSAGATKRAYMLLFWLGRDERRPSHERRRSWAIEELGLTMTVTHWRRDGPEVAFLGHLAGLLAGRTQAHDRYAHEAFDLTYVFDHAGRLVEHHITARLRATVAQKPHSEFVLVTDAYPNHSFRLDALMGCTLTGEAQSKTGFPLVVLARGPAVQVGDVVNVAARFSVQTGSTIDRIGWTMGSEADSASILLRFHPSRMPETAWSFRDSDSTEGGMASFSEEEDRLLPLGGDFFQTFPMPWRDRWFGLFWTWPER